MKLPLIVLTIGAFALAACSTADIPGIGSLNPLGAGAGGSANVLPFPVSIGGQAAQPMNSVAAKIPSPVSAGAGIAAVNNGEDVIVNIFPSDAAGNVPSGASATVYLLGTDGRGVLSKPYSGSAPKPGGTYLANVVIRSKGTSRVVFTVR